MIARPCASTPGVTIERRLSGIIHRGRSVTGRKTECQANPTFATRSRKIPQRWDFRGHGAEVPALEQAADLPPGGRVDHHLVGPREAL